MTNASTSRIVLALRRHPIRILAESGFAFAAFWTVIEASQSFLQWEIAGGFRFSLLVLGSALVGVWRALPSNSREVIIPGTGTRLIIEFSDLFSQDGIVAVPVNEYFDCVLGAHVSPKSVHGQAISKLFGGDSARFEASVERALAGVACEKVERASGRKHRYRIGTTAFLGPAKPGVLAFALATTDLSTLKVSATVPQMWVALQGLLGAARVHCNDNMLSLPIVGGGLSGVGQPAQQLLSLIIMSVTAESRRNRVCGRIKICLLDSIRDEVDIDAAIAQVR